MPLSREPTIVLAESPALAWPRERVLQLRAPQSAGRQFVQIQQRQHLGHLDDLRARAGRIDLRPTGRSPESASTRLSLTRAVLSVTANATASTSRSR